MITKYIKFSITTGNKSSNVTSAKIIVMCDNGVLNYELNDSYFARTAPTSTTIPTLATDVPKGFEVINVGSDATVWKWVFNGTAWKAVSYPA